MPWNCEALDMRTTLPHSRSTLPETSAVNLTIFEGPHNRLTFLVTGEHVLSILTDRDSCDRLFVFHQNLGRRIDPCLRRQHVHEVSILPGSICPMLTPTVYNRNLLHR